MDQYRNYIQIVTTTTTTTTVRQNLSKCALRSLSAKSIFPPDYFTADERQQGAILIHILILLYVIIFSEHVYDKYFLPSLEYLSFERLQLSAHRAGLSILTIGASINELSLAIFSVTLGRNDLGLYTIIGSATYNMLMIMSVCCFCVYAFQIKLNKSTFLKHSALYALNLLVLIGILYKNNNSKFYWYDSLTSIMIYVTFAVITINEHSIRAFIAKFYRCCFCCCRRHKQEDSKTNIDEEESDPSLSPKKEEQQKTSTDNLLLINKFKLVDLVKADSDNNFHSYQTSIYVNDSYNEPYDFLQAYKEIKPLNLSKKFKLITVLPARILAYLMIVDFRRFQTRKNFFFPITLGTSFLLLILCSFIFIWMVTTICDTFAISKPIFGIIFLPSLVCMKESIAIQSMSKRELKKMRDSRHQKEELQQQTMHPTTIIEETHHQSQRLGLILSSYMSCNLFDMTVVLGFPYLINSLVSGSFSSNIYAGKNLSVILAGLLFCMCLFLLTFIIFRFRISIFIGFVLMVIWVFFMIFVFVLEIDVLDLSYFEFLRKFVCS